MDTPHPALAALADPTRYRLLKLLLERDLCVGALARELEISAPAVSQHLKKLKESGLVTGQKRGYWTHYAVDRETLLLVANQIESLAGVLRNDGLECQRRDAMGNCCCTKAVSWPRLNDFRKGEENE